MAEQQDIKEHNGDVRISGEGSSGSSGKSRSTRRSEHRKLKKRNPTPHPFIVEDQRSHVSGVQPNLSPLCETEEEDEISNDTKQSRNASRSSGNHSKNSSRKEGSRNTSRSSGSHSKISGRQEESRNTSRSSDSNGRNSGRQEESRNTLRPSGSNGRNSGGQKERRHDVGEIYTAVESHSRFEVMPAHSQTQYHHNYHARYCREESVQMMGPILRRKKITSLPLGASPRHAAFFGAGHD
eukprot:11168950-Ditylum_brightwellii.AAC.1